MSSQGLSDHKKKCHDMFSKGNAAHPVVCSYGNDIKAKANESFKNSAFFDIEATVNKIFLKRSEHI
jgi:hypothetical protein